MYLRVIDDGDGAPAWNMAVDEALLRTPGEPTLRLYRWRPHAVSLGHFQDLRDFADVPAGTPVVRRSTGGGAIHHADELTFALTVPTGLLGLDVDDGYARVHDAVAQALLDVGAPVHRLRDGRVAGARPAGRWCFQHPGRHDLVDGSGRKVVGSAQRRIRSPAARVLHHGSIVLRRPPLTPFAGAVTDATGLDPEPQLRAALAARLAAALRLLPRPGRLGAAETAQATTLCRLCDQGRRVGSGPVR